VDYLSLGLPLLNNLIGELAEMVREENAGFNFVSSNTADLIAKLKTISALDVCRLRANAHEAFSAHYSYDVLEDTLDAVLADLGVDAQ
jgi:glycosyltransferase involved in cell wall biosynthesis